MAAILSRPQYVKTLKPEQNGHQFVVDIFKYFVDGQDGYIYWTFNEVCSLGSNWWSVSTGWGNGFASNTQQTIAWRNDVLNPDSI